MTIIPLSLIKALPTPIEGLDLNPEVFQNVVLRPNPWVILSQVGVGGVADLKASYNYNCSIVPGNRFTHFLPLLLSLRRGVCAEYKGKAEVIGDSEALWAFKNFLGDGPLDWHKAFLGVGYDGVCQLDEGTPHWKLVSLPLSANYGCLVGWLRYWIPHE